MTTKIWHVIRVEPGKDGQVGADLAGQGYDPFLAWTFVKVTRGNLTTREVSLRLAGYVFVGVDYGRVSFRPIVDTLHVMDFLSFGEIGGERRPSSVPEAVIDGLKRDQIEDFDAVTRRVRRKNCPYSVGQTVVIPELQFQGPVEETRNSSVIVKINGFPWRVDLSKVEALRPFQGGTQGKESAA